MGNIGKERRRIEVLPAPDPVPPPAAPAPANPAPAREPGRIDPQRETEPAR